MQCHWAGHDAAGVCELLPQRNAEHGRRPVHGVGVGVERGPNNLRLCFVVGGHSRLGGDALSTSVCA